MNHRDYSGLTRYALLKLNREFDFPVCPDTKQIRDASSSPHVSSQHLDISLGQIPGFNFHHAIVSIHLSIHRCEDSF